MAVCGYITIFASVDTFGGEAGPFAVQASQSGIVCNDVINGPTVSYTSTQLQARNIETRRRVSYCRYNIASIKETGREFENCYLSWNFADRIADRNIYVYGIKEEIDNTTLSGISWSTAPGVQNTPVPPLDAEITIDTLDNADISPLLLSYMPASKNTWLSTPASAALDDFLNGDTDGDITLMFIAYDPQGADFRIYDYVDYRFEPVTGLKGVILRGGIIPEPATLSLLALGGLALLQKRR
jgi:hypothetical protein